MAGSIRSRTHGAGLRACALLGLVAIGLLAGGVSSASAATKDYSANIAPPSEPPGVVASMTATLTNLTKTQQLGSANLTPPPGFTLQDVTPLSPPATATIDGNVLKLRELALQPAASMTVSFSVLTACQTGTITTPWKTEAKQSNDFQGAPGNGLTLDKTQSAITTTTIGACVPCPEDSSGEQCTAALSQPGSALNMRANPNATADDSGVLRMRPLAPGQVDCPGWTEYAPGYQYDAPPNRDQVFTLTYPGTRSGDPLDVCFGATVQFPVKPGTDWSLQVVDGETLYVGRLPNCIGFSSAPCVVSRDPKGRSITATKGPGDPYPR